MPPRPFRQPRPSIRLAQNFLKDASLVAELLSRTDLSEDDLVYEIGPGRGMITRELARVCGKVVAIELDESLAVQLRRQFANVSTVEIVSADVLQFEFPNLPYKVFSNIPFNLTADILRKLVYSGCPPLGAYLIVQKQAAEKYSGLPRECQASVLLKPWFAFSVLHQFNRTDFDPVPGVEVVLLEIQKRQVALVDSDETKLYRQFVTYGFSRQRANLGKSYKKVFSHLQWKRLADDLGFDVHAHPADLIFEQWLGVFQFFRDGIKNGSVRVPIEMRELGPSGTKYGTTAPAKVGLPDQRWKHRKAKQVR